MARRIRDTTLDSREARRKLKVRGKPYWRAIEKGLHLGYRRLKGKAGTWVTRHYLGNQSYVTEAIGPADDLSDADGVAILDFWQAQQKAREHMVRRAHAANGVAGPLTVKDAVEAYFAALDDEGRDTSGVRKRAAAHIYPTLGDVEIATLTTEALTNWRAGLSRALPRVRTSKGAPQRYREVGNDEEAIRRRRASAERVWIILRAALNRAYHASKIVSAEAWRKVKPYRQVAAARVRHLLIAESRRLVNACDPEFRAVVRVGLETGCRYGEICRLQVGDFNPDAGTLAVRRSKSGKPRHVVLTPEGAAFFAQLVAGRAGGELLLRHADGSAWGRSHQQTPMARAVARARISPSATFHTLRHTWASHAVMAGMPLMVVARNLGHVDTKMVERHYGHLAPSFITDAIRAHAPRFGFKPERKVVALKGRA
jgi:integrase